MADLAAPTWRMTCPWCDTYLLVGGLAGTAAGSNVSALRILRGHVERKHGRTWEETLDLLLPQTRELRSELQAAARRDDPWPW